MYYLSKYITRRLLVIDMNSFPLFICCCCCRGSRMFLLLVVYSSFFSACWSSQDFVGDQVLRILPTNNDDNNFLRKWLEDSSLELDIWHEQPFPNASIDVHVPSNKLQVVKTILNSKQIRFVVLINDLSKTVEEENQSNQKNAFAYGFSYDQYNRYGAIQSEIKRLASQSNGKAKVVSLGRSHESRSMDMIMISTDFNQQKPIVWIDGGIHAREWISPATVMHIIKEILQHINDGTQPSIDKYEFHILPVFNVDGYEYTHLYNRMWRKTRKRIDFRCYGVDPNRNWGTDFGRVGVSWSPCRDTYPGPKAFSEVEVRNVANHLKANRNRLKSYWTFHAYSQLVLTPWGYTRSPPKDDYEIQRVGRIFANKLRTYYGTYYRVGSPANILYPASGGSIDWVYQELGVVYSYGLELRDKGRHGFVLPASQITPSGIETANALFAALDAMH